MGHRALIAHEQPDGTYTVYYTHWGASNLRLREPFRNDYADRPAEHGDVDADPWEEGLTLEEVVTDTVQYGSHDGFYHLPRNGKAEAAITLPYSFAGDDGPDTDHEGNEVPTDPHDGALYSPRWYDGEPLSGRGVGWFEGYRRALAEDVSDELRTWPEALRELDAFVYGRFYRRGSEPQLLECSPRGRTPADASHAVHRHRR